MINERISDYVELIKESLLWFSTQPILVILLGVYLIGATYTDIKSLKVYDKYNSIFFVLFLVYFLLSSFTNIQGIDNLGWGWHISGMIVAFFSMLIPAMILMHKMGGDIKLTTVIGFVISLPLYFPFFIITCILAALYGFPKKYLFKKPVLKFPFAPFFLGSYIVLFIITIILKGGF